MTLLLFLLLPLHLWEAIRAPGTEEDIRDSSRDKGEG